jgi:sec-independent protein translocase protein TatA
MRPRANSEPASAEGGESHVLGLDNPLHIVFLLVVLLLVFGAKRLPELGRSLGSGLRGFKETLSGEFHEPPAGTPTARQLGDDPIARATVITDGEEVAAGPRR